MTTERVSRGGRPRTRGNEDDLLVTVSLHVRKSQLAELDPKRAHVVDRLAGVARRQHAATAGSYCRALPGTPCRPCRHSNTPSKAR
jgi:hypothetical protein